MLDLKKLKVRLTKPFSRTYPYVFRFKFLNNIHKFYINSSVEVFRVMDWGGEEEYTADILKELSEKSVLYDIGSSIGLVTVLAAKQMKKGRVIAFEPDNEIFERLLKNLELNKLENVSALKYAIGEQNGITSLYSKGADDFSPRLTTSKQNITSSYKVPVYQIDTLLAKKEIPYPDVVKIDVEGFEKQVLMGMKRLLGLKQKPKTIFLEIHPEFVVNFGSSVQDILDFVLQNNYKIVYIKRVHEQLLCKFCLV